MSQGCAGYLSRFKARQGKGRTAYTPRTVDVGLGAGTENAGHEASPEENLGWAYDRIVGALANLCHRLSGDTVGSILRRHRIARLQPRATSPPFLDTS